MAESVINLQKNPFMLKQTGAGTTFSFTFPLASTSSFALLFGRYGYASQTMSMSLISHPDSGVAHVKNYGDQDLTVSCTGDTVTVTCPQAYASVWIISPAGII